MGKICYEAFWAEGAPAWDAWEDASPTVRARFEAIGERIQAAMGAHCLASAKALDTHRDTLCRSIFAAAGVAGF